MPNLATRVATAHSARYLQQLCKHWSHKFDARCEGGNGKIQLPGGVLTLEAGEEALELTLAGEDPAELSRLAEVVATHLDRFAFREAPLGYDWR